MYNNNIYFVNKRVYNDNKYFSYIYKIYCSLYEMMYNENIFCHYIYMEVYSYYTRRCIMTRNISVIHRLV